MGWYTCTCIMYHESDGYLKWSWLVWTHRGCDKMAAIFQTFLNCLTKSPSMAPYFIRSLITFSYEWYIYFNKQYSLTLTNLGISHYYKCYCLNHEELVSTTFLSVRCILMMFYIAITTWLSTSFISICWNHTTCASEIPLLNVWTDILGIGQ